MTSEQVAHLRKTAASIFGDQDDADVELVFMLAEQGSATPQQGQPKSKSGKAAKRRREGLSW
jgi:hypothetical protein